MRELTKRQNDTVTFIKNYIDVNAYPPTLREIADYLTITPKGAQEHLKALQKKGILRVDPHRSRSIELLQEQHNRMCGLPFYEWLPTFNLPNVFTQETLMQCSVPIDFIQDGSDHFVTLMPDSSMQALGICKEDKLIFRRANEANERSIVLAYLHDRYTIRQYAKNGSRYCLTTAPNDVMLTSTIYTQSVQLIAQLIGVLRSYE